MKQRWQGLICCVFLLGCVSTHPPDPGLQQHAIQRCGAKTVKLKQRLRLNIGQRSYDLQGFLLLSRAPQRYYAAAYAEAPAPIFAFREDQTGKQILSAPAMLPELILKNGVMDDLKLAFLDNRDDQWHSGPPSAPTTLWRLAPNGDALAKISFAAYKPQGNCQFAENITIENYQYPYTLNITLLEYSDAMSAETIDKVFAR